MWRNLEDLKTKTIKFKLGKVYKKRVAVIEF